mmetsp:Transcript_11106/g.30686  ORF Transcript_11106/g.30686 Transcript_11106/m.30686 type:complete len:92 (+) Transcript_11106:90-365(+)
MAGPMRKSALLLQTWEAATIAVTLPAPPVRPRGHHVVGVPGSAASEAEQAGNWARRQRSAPVYQSVLSAERNRQTAPCANGARTPNIPSMC